MARSPRLVDRERFPGPLTRAGQARGRLPPPTAHGFSAGGRGLHSCRAPNPPRQHRGVPPALPPQRGARAPRAAPRGVRRAASLLGWAGAPRAMPRTPPLLPPALSWAGPGGVREGPVWGATVGLRLALGGLLAEGSRGTGPGLPAASCRCLGSRHLPWPQPVPSWVSGCRPRQAPGPLRSPSVTGRPAQWPRATGSVEFRLCRYDLGGREAGDRVRPLTRRPAGPPPVSRAPLKALAAAPRGRGSWGSLQG